MSLLARNAEALNNARSHYNNILLAPVKAKTSGLYQGYDARSGCHTVKLTDGSIVYGQMISNGAAGIGDSLSVIRPQGSLMATFDTMPN